jgi:UDPglucose 6-dehydrogenase
MKFCVVGAGYVGLANAILFATKYETVILDIDPKRVEKIRNLEPTIKDDLASEYLSNYELNLTATSESAEAFRNSEITFIATPTDFNPDKQFFDTNSVETVIEESIRINPNSLIVIKSTIPVGFTERMRKRFNSEKIIFSPEFLREGQALYDCMHPSRIIIGDKNQEGLKLEKITRSLLEDENTKFILTNPNEAESIKLFANSYLAMRVSFFNELDSYAELQGLNTREIIEGISSDPRIGSHYNNPSFGYGGYCLPKDTKQLAQNMSKSVNKVVNAVIESNEERIKFITQQIIKKNKSNIGIFKLSMKSGSDNYRSSSILKVMQNLKETHNLSIYDPSIIEEKLFNIKVEKDFNTFCEKSDLIVCNRYESKLEKYKFKVYTRDIFEQDL